MATQKLCETVNRKSLCGYLKKLFIKGGKHEVTRYRDYLSKELNNTCDWWTKEVMIHIDIEKEKTKKHDRECRKEKQLLDYFVKQVQEGNMTLQDIKNDVYREMVLDATVPW